MTATEMHVRVQLGLQKQSSDRYTSVKESEIDIALNEAQVRFVKRKFEQSQPSQKVVDDLRKLYVKNFRLPLLKPSTTGYDSYMQELDMYYSPLPHNYLYLVNDRTESQFISGSQCQVPTTAGDNVKEFSCVVNYTATTSELCAPEPIFRIEINGVTVFDLADWPELKYKKIEQKHELIALVLQYLNRFNSLSELINFSKPGNTYLENNNNENYFHVYWERYKDEYYPSSFIFVSNSDDVTLGSEDDDALFASGNLGMLVELFTAEDAQSSVRFLQRSYGTEIVDSESASLQTHPNRLTKHEDLYRVLGYPFTKSTLKSPVSVLSSDFIMVYSDGETFIPRNIILDYVRKPMPISKKLGWDCELAEHTHNEIIDEAIIYLMAITDNAQGLQLKIAETKANNP